ncbi:hypothetical protein HMPREF9946_02923 [Acetobacteraceae bacterium AT-5844]|nr:hypothetical protein HMPREF9946_02923 [Acetobacteraceae bacterium AT-5844]
MDSFAFRQGYQGLSSACSGLPLFARYTGIISSWIFRKSFRFSLNRWRAAHQAAFRAR